MISGYLGILDGRYVVRKIGTASEMKYTDHTKIFMSF